MAIASDDPAADLPRPFGPFTLLRLIAQGGMGQVFLALRQAEDGSADEVCVVKTIRADLKADREAIGRFLDEARVAQRLDHASICHTLDAGVIDKTYFLALEFISGRNLRDVQARANKLERKLPDELIFHCMDQVLDALHYAHQLRDEDTGKPLGIVHRDISPHNVMLGFDGYTKLIDFGLADHQLKRELTRPGIMVGKLRYNAPEQVRDRAIDGRSDLYALGVVLYELLVRERFYEGLSEDDIWRVAMKGTHIPRAWNRVPADLRPVLEVVLAPAPEQRPADAPAMRAWLQELAERRGLGHGRRIASRFMAELFAQERQAEREMILQATGMAEARTRLFFLRRDGTTSVGDAIGNASSVGRSTVVSAADLRGRLSSLLSEFDPDAETVLPQAPMGFDNLASHLVDLPAQDEKPLEPHREPDRVLNRATTRETNHEANQEANREPKPAPDHNRAHNAPAPHPTQGDDEDSVMRAEHEALASTQPHAGEAERSLSSAELFVRGLSMESGSKHERPPTSSAASDGALPSGSSPSASLSTDRIVRDRRSHASGTTPRAGQRNISAVLIVGGTLLFFGLLGVAVAVFLPPMLTGDRRAQGTAFTTTTTAPTATAPTEIAPTRPQPSTAQTSGDEPDAPGAASNTEPAVGVSPASSVTPPAVAAPIHADAGPVDAAPLQTPDAAPNAAPTGVVATPPSRPTASTSKRPPNPAALRTLKERVAYLRSWCLDRVACARPTVGSASRIAALSPEETKALLQDLTSCINSCAQDGTGH